MSKTKTKPKKRRHRILYALIVTGLAVAALVWLYTGSLIGVDDGTVETYRALQERIIEKGYEPRLLVISGRRYSIDNKLLAMLGGAAKNSRHLRGDALDIIVLDINRDGTADHVDVDIVHRILDQELVGDRGGVGTYKTESGFFNRQMVHFDLRGRRARWNR